MSTRTAPEPLQDRRTPPTVAGSDAGVRLDSTEVLGAAAAAAAAAVFRHRGSSRGPALIRQKLVANKRSTIIACKSSAAFLFSSLRRIHLYSQISAAFLERQKKGFHFFFSKDELFAVLTYQPAFRQPDLLRLPLGHVAADGLALRLLLILSLLILLPASAVGAQEG